MLAAVKGIIQGNTVLLDEDVRAYYREELLTKKEESAQSASLDMSYAGWEIDIPNIAAMSNEEYAMARRHGLGGSDGSLASSVDEESRKTTLDNLYLQAFTGTIDERTVIAIGTANPTETLGIISIIPHFGITDTVFYPSCIPTTYTANFQVPVNHAI